MSKRTERQRAHDRAEEWLSKYIRLRDCLRTMGSDSYGRCITCGNVVEYDQCDAGHYVAGRKDAYVFDEHCVHLQCRACNKHGHGKVLDYRDAMIEMYGVQETERLEGLRHLPMKLSVDELRWISDYYREKYNALSGSMVYVPDHEILISTGTKYTVVAGEYMEAS